MVFSFSNKLIFTHDFCQFLSFLLNRPYVELQSYYFVIDFKRVPLFGALVMSNYFLNRINLCILDSTSRLLAVVWLLTIASSSPSIWNESP